MRYATLTYALAATVLALDCPHLQAKPLPPPATDAVPPVELRVGLTDGKATCSPAELPLPADTNIVLNVVSTADRPVTITMAGQFEKGRVEHADGDLGHGASASSYTVKANGKGTLRLRTPPPGEHPFACTSTADQSEPFRGKVILSKPAG